MLIKIQKPFSFLICKKKNRQSIVVYLLFSPNNDIMYKNKLNIKNINELTDDCILIYVKKIIIIIMQ